MHVVNQASSRVRLNVNKAIRYSAFTYVRAAVSDDVNPICQVEYRRMYSKSGAANENLVSFHSGHVRSGQVRAPPSLTMQPTGNEGTALLFLSYKQTR